MVGEMVKVGGIGRYYIGKIGWVNENGP
jgi:hypothetical protein